jgi:phospholipase/carboxylesterase
MAKLLDGPRRPARSGRTRALVVLLHGYGASGHDLIDLADLMADALPDAAFAAPHAVERMPFPGAEGYQWFQLSTLAPDELAEGTRRAAPSLDAFLDRELATTSVPPERLALVGFSQGTMMALHVGLRRARAPAAIVGLSGVVAAGAELAAEIASRPPVMLVHGSADDVIPVAALHLTREVLAGAGISVDWHVRDGLGHGIDEEVVRMTAQYLARRLG